MAVGEDQTHLRYMAVPEKIELGGVGDRGGGVTREPSGGGGMYKPMKVPDKITLEPAIAPPPTAPSGGESGEEDRVVLGGGGGKPQRGGMRGGIGQSGFQPSEPSHFAEQRVQSLTIPEDGQTSHALVELERRVRTLEHQVQRLTNTVVNSRPATTSSGTNQGNGFWYVLTFTGWMMVPLVVVFMYHFKKSL